MMINMLPTYTERQLYEFAKKEREKTKLLLRKHYTLSESDFNDVFNDSLFLRPRWEVNNQKCTAVRQHIHISSQLFGVKEVGYVKDTTAGDY